MFRRTAVLVMLVSLIVVVLAPVAAIGKGKSTIELVPLSSQASVAGSSLSVGDQVTYRVSTNRTSTPWVRTSCYQNDVLVSFESHGFWEAYPFGTTFTLGPTNAWTEGEARCVGELGYFSRGGRWHGVARVVFSVN